MSAVSNLSCPACGIRFEMPPAYLAEHGGQSATCLCGHTLRLPTAGAVAATPVASDPPLAALAVPMVVQPATPEVSPAQAVPQSMLSYAAQPVIGPGNVFQAVRDGDRLVVSRIAPTVLPGCCVLCGQVVNVIVTQTFYWAPPWTYFLLLPGVVPYLVAMVFMRKSVVVLVPFCARHRQKRWILSTVGSTMALMSFICPPLFYHYHFGEILGRAITGAVLVCGLVISMIGQRTLRPRRMTDTHAWFNGASPEFMALLSET